MIRWLGFSALLAAALALAACSGGTGAASKPAGGGPQTITVNGSDQMRFNPPSLTVTAGSPVRLTLNDAGAALVHDFTIDNLGGQRVHIEAQPNSSATGELTAPAGTYQFYCAQPGHREAGMQGTLTAR